MPQTTKCLIVDDEPLAIDVLRDYIAQVPQLELVTTCQDAMQAFQVLNEQQVDLVFLDIEMPEINGIDFIKSLAQPPAIILTTAYREYALESYEIEVVDYLLKPVSFKRFFKSITKYLKSIDAPTTKQIAVTPTPKGKGSIYVYSNKKNIKVHFEEMLYLESIKDYIRIHTSERTIISKDTISRYEELLPNSFLRIHRSYIVNTSKITAFTAHDIEIEDKEIPIGTSYKKAVINRLKQEA